MGTIPTPPTLVAGAVLTAAQLNQMRDVMNFWATAPRVSAYQAVAQTLTTSGTFYPIALDTEVFDVVQSGDSPMHDTSTNNSRLYCRTAGKYRIGAQCSFNQASSTGIRSVQVRLNAAGNPASGTQLFVGNIQPLNGFATVAGGTPFLYPLNAGDYIEMFGQQGSGGSLGTWPGLGYTFAYMELAAA